MKVYRIIFLVCAIILGIESVRCVIMHESGEVFNLVCGTICWMAYESTKGRSGK